MKGYILGTDNHKPYLEVVLSNTLSGNDHTGNITIKAHKALGFIQRNLGKCPMIIKSQSNITLLKPTLEYASIV